jgi:hypothetical protein
VRLPELPRDGAEQVTHRSFRDWAVVFLGAVLIMCGCFDPLGWIFLGLGLFARFADWFGHGQVMIFIRRNKE